MPRDAAIASACAWFDRGAFTSDLADLVAFRTESQRPDAGPDGDPAGAARPTGPDPGARGPALTGGKITR